MQPWFIAVERFTPDAGEPWQKYVAWSGLTQLDEVVSLDSMLCPPILSEIKDEYWKYIVNEDHLLDYFVDLEFMLTQLPDRRECNVLCVYRNPQHDPVAPPGPLQFEFLGYDLVDRQGTASALTNCGGWPGILDNAELSPQGLLASRTRALVVQRRLLDAYPDERHADCDIWAIFRAA